MTRFEQWFGIDLRALAAFRVGLAALVLADLVYRCLDFRAHYTGSGILPRDLHRELFSTAAPAWSIHFLSDAAIFQAGLFALAFAAAVTLLIGYRPRAAGMLSWILLVSVQNRQPLIVHGGDMILRLLLFWSIFLPLPGRGFFRAAVRRSEPPRIALSPASAALLLQVALIYLFAAIHKFQAPEWIRLTAIEDSFQVEGVATGLASALLAWPGLLAAMTASTLILEVTAPLLAFSPWKTGAMRTLLVFGMGAFHLLGIGGTMRLGLMEYAMCVAWIPFLPANFWDRVFSRVQMPAKSVSRLPSPGIVASSLAVAAFSIVVANNLISLDPAGFRHPNWSSLHALTRTLALSQNWRLWSTPLRNRYYVFPACLEDGSTVDLHTGRALDWDQPRRRSRNNHWWKFQLHALEDRRGARLLPTYAAHLAREWEREHPGNPVASIRMFWIDAAPPGKRPSEYSRRLIWKNDAPPNHRCTATRFESLPARQSFLPSSQDSHQRSKLAR
jgi:hypothetical protein